MHFFFRDTNLVVFINNDDRLSSDVDEAASVFRSMNYVVQRLKGIDDFVKPSIRINNLVVIFLGFGYGDRVFLDKNKNESVTYDEMSDYFKSKNVKNTIILVETSTSYGHCQTICRRPIENYPQQVYIVTLRFLCNKSSSFLLKFFLEYKQQKKSLEIDPFFGFLSEKIRAPYLKFDYHSTMIYFK